MTEFKFPSAVLAQHIGVVGKTGSGKTSTAKLIVEQAAAEGARVCVLDPIKSDWWGLISSADGRRAGLPFTVLGGPRGHVPLHSSAGKAIGEIVASGALPLSILDMADFEPGGLQRFFVDFASILFKRMRGVVHLVIEEAHEFAPKERSGIGGENMALHWAKKLATGSRTKGIRLVLATQRTQSLHNALLGSCETMVVHRLTLPADQKPVKDWLKENTPKDIRERVEGSLSSLKTGSGWLCSGEAGIFELVQFPRIATYDNTATPTGDGSDHRVVTAPVDQQQLRAIIGDAVKEAEANDPAKLKAEIARLQSDAGKKPAYAVPQISERVVIEPDPEAEVRGFLRGVELATKAFRLHADRSAQRIRIAFDAVDEARKAAFDPAVYSDAFNDVASELKSGLAGAPTTPTAPTRAPVGPSAARTFSPPSPAPSGDGTLTPSLQKCLDAIAWWRKIGIEPVERSRACVVAGFSPKASTFGVYIAELAKRGLVDVTPGHLQLTGDGRALARAPAAATARDLYEMARGLLAPKEQEVFDVVYRAAPKAIRRDAVAASVGLSPTASTCGVYLAAVAAYGIIENAGPGQVRAAGWLFPS